MCQLYTALYARLELAFFVLFTSAVTFMGGVLVFGVVLLAVSALLNFFFEENFLSNNFDELLIYCGGLSLILNVKLLIKTFYETMTSLEKRNVER